MSQWFDAVATTHCEEWQLTQLTRMIRFVNERGYESQFDYHDVNRLVTLCTALGYECYRLDEGALQDGDWFLESPSGKFSKMPSFYVTEKYVNCYMTSQKITVYARLRDVPQEVWDRVRETQVEYA